MTVFKVETSRIGQSSSVNINQLLLGLMQICVVYQLKLLNTVLSWKMMLDQFGRGNIG